MMDQGKTRVPFVWGRLERLAAAASIVTLLVLGVYVGSVYWTLRVNWMASGHSGEFILADGKAVVNDYAFGGGSWGGASFRCRLTDSVPTQWTDLPPTFRTTSGGQRVVVLP